ncbi:response regulator [Kineosporia mesophila]|uniref:Response regulator n=1 Tax=Kineosporia mesophila TaxID=566012 RepID=A0ABP6ZL06_9ACTN|nr:response regulator [Kineosporia mesophila]MCD5354504.1 response regulator [Kineosporia mesophila]
MVSIRERSILLVDDDDNDVEMTRWALHRSHIANDLIVARDGLEALALLLPEDGREPLEPSIVLMDVNMPRLGGVETLRRLRVKDRTRHLPVVLLTSSPHDREALDSCDVQANGYVTKPLEAENFLTLAAGLGLFWLDVHPTPSHHSLTSPEP